MISIVSPVYKAENIIETLVSQIDIVMKKIGVSYEIILVDDRSPDNSWQKMKELKSKNQNLKIIRLSRNFGQHPTIMAGLEHTKGDWVVVMDCDMQDQPKEIEKLYHKAMEGYDVVTARRITRKDSKMKVISSALFYKVFNYLSDMEINHEIANFGIYKREVISAVLQVKDQIKFFPLFINWVGFKNISIDIEHGKREFGSSSYSLRKLISLAFNTIVSFSDKPLRLFVGFGATISLISILIGGYYLFSFFMGNITEPGFTSIILSIWFLFGVLISCIGIVGIYIGKTFNQAKNRPIYIIDELL